MVVQWLRICLVMQGTQFQSLVQELRSHVPRSDYAHERRLLSPRAAAKIPRAAAKIPRAAAKTDAPK